MIDSPGSGVSSLRKRSLLHRLFSLLLLLPLFVPLISHAQQPSPITVQVQAGYGAGDYRLSSWFPVTLEIANAGPDIRATVEWNFVNSDRGNFRREIDLPRGAQKRLTMDVLSGDFARAAELRVLDGDTELFKQTVRLTPADSGQLMIGVVSSDATLLNSLAILQLDRSNGTTVTHLDPASLPETSLALAGLDVLFLHDLATAELAPAQREALELWTHLGGQLVVSGGVSAERSVPGLAQLLPVEVGPLQANSSIQSLQRLLNRNDLLNVVPSTTVSATTLRPGAKAIDEAGLLSTIDRGAGRVVFSAFDLSVLRAWTGESELWRRVLRAEPRMDIGYVYRLRSDNLLRNALQLASLNFPSIFAVIGLVLTYIVLVGPLNFLVLRRMRRPDLAWLTVPAIVLLCLLATYGASFVLRGTRPQLLQLTIAQGFEGRSEGLGTAFVGVFSPQRRDYRLSVASEALISSRAFDGFDSTGVTVTSTDGANEVRDLLIDVSSLRTLIVEQPGVEIPSVTSQLQRNNNSVAGQITYNGAAPLENAQLVYGDSASDLGTLTPGQNLEVAFEKGLNNFPGSGIVNDEGQIFNRAQVLSNLYDFDRFAFNGPNFDGTRGLPEKDAVYLLGWVNTALLPMQLDGSAADQQGMVLYIIRLNS
jgi:hypothetical protein